MSILCVREHLTPLAPGSKYVIPPEKAVFFVSPLEADKPDSGLELRVPNDRAKPCSTELFMKTSP